MKFLEDLRDDDFNKRSLVLTTEPPLFNFISFNEYSILAYRYTLQNLSDLEASKTSLNFGLQCCPAISMWFLSADAFMNTLLKIACLKSQHNYHEVLALPLAGRYLSLLRILKFSEEKAEQNEIINRLNEFEVFYRHLSYDLHEHEKLNFKSTVFSGSPSFLNQVDVLQSFLIAYEMFERFRFVLNGLDLMPNISLGVGNNKIVYEKLTVLKNKVVIPSVKDILSKHKLNVRLPLDTKFKNYPVSALFEPRQIIPIFKYQQNEKYKLPVSEGKTDIVSNFHALLTKKYIGNEDRYGLNFTAPDFK